MAGYGEVPLVADEGVFDDGRSADGLPLRSGEAEAGVLTAGKSAAQVHHAIRVRVWVGVYEDGIDDAEDCGGGSDAEGQRDDGGEGEAGGFPQLAQRVTQILKQGRHRW